MSGMVAASGKPAAKKPVRDSKRRASHSQIERRRREKINDRLVTLRTIVPACAAEIEERRRVRLQEEDEARRIAAGELVLGNGQDSGGKRRRKRRRAAAAAAAAANGATMSGSADKDEDLGLHKLEVLTHTIEYIFELEAQLHEIKTGERLARRRVVDDEEGTDAGQDTNPTLGTPAVRSTFKAVDEDTRNSMQWADLESSHHRRSTLSSVSESSMMGASPVFRPLTTFSSTSPSFTGRSTEMTSPTYASLTTSMMSLSAESPLLRWNSTSTAATTPQSFAQTPSSSVMAAQHTKAGDKASLSDLPMLPAPAMPIDEKLKQDRENSSKGSKKGTGLKRSRPAADEDVEHHDAELLLALKASPDVMRPLESQHMKQASASRSSRPEARRSSLSLPHIWRTPGRASLTMTDASRHAPAVRIKQEPSPPMSLAGKSAPGGAFPVLTSQFSHMPQSRARADTTSFSSGAPHYTQSVPVHPGDRAHALVSLPSPPMFALDAAAPSSVRTSLASSSRSPPSRDSS